MQGTFVLLMALSGLGCHNKCYDVAYAPPSYTGCFGNGCYANVYPNYMAPAFVMPSCYSACYGTLYNGCYAGCFGGGCFGGGYSSCYAACYGGCYARRHHGCGLLSWLSHLCGWKSHGYYGDWGYGGYGWPYGAGSAYEPAIYGYALEYNYGAGTTPTTPGATPMEAAPTQPSPVPPGPAPSATPTPPPPAPETITPPPPPPRPATVPNVTPPPKPTT
jgi:hypothetical protein